MCFILSGLAKGSDNTLIRLPSSTLDAGCTLSFSVNNLRFASIIYIYLLPDIHKTGNYQSTCRFSVIEGTPVGAGELAPSLPDTFSREGRSGASPEGDHQGPHPTAALPPPLQ